MSRSNRNQSTNDNGRERSAADSETRPAQTVKNCPAAVADAGGQSRAVASLVKMGGEPKTPNDVGKLGCGLMADAVMGNLPSANIGMAVHGGNLAMRGFEHSLLKQMSRRRRGRGQDSESQPDDDRDDPILDRLDELNAKADEIADAVFARA